MIDTKLNGFVFAFSGVNLLKIENDQLIGEQILFFSDIICTG